MTKHRGAYGVEPGNASGQQAHDDPGGSQKPCDNVCSDGKKAYSAHDNLASRPQRAIATHATRAAVLGNPLCSHNLGFEPVPGAEKSAHDEVLGQMDIPAREAETIRADVNR